MRLPGKSQYLEVNAAFSPLVFCKQTASQFERSLRARSHAQALTPQDARVWVNALRRLQRSACAAMAETSSAGANGPVGTPAREPDAPGAPDGSEPATEPGTEPGARPPRMTPPRVVTFEEKAVCQDPITTLQPVTEWIRSLFASDSSPGASAPPMTFEQATMPQVRGALPASQRGLA